MLNDAFIQSTLESVKKHTPEQGPLEYFVHHNTLHHYEHSNFFDATKQAAIEYKTNAFMPEEYYWDAYQSQKIQKGYLMDEIKRFSLKHKLKLPAQIVYRLLIQKETENDYSGCSSKIRYLSQCQREELAFYDKAFRDDHGIEIDYIMSPHIFKFFAAYFDFGSAYWPMTRSGHGLLDLFLQTYKKSTLFSGKYLRRLAKSIRSIQSESNTSLLQKLLTALHISEVEAHAYLFSICLRYKGWMGLIKSLEDHPDWVKNKNIKPSFIDAVTVLVLCEYAAIQMLLNGKSETPNIPRSITVTTHSDRFLNYYIYEREKHPEIAADFDASLLALCDHNRQEILHRAFEATFYNQFLDSYTTQSPLKKSAKPKYQVICCIDEREESFRRYLEADSDCETFGTAGHFGLAMTFQGYFDKHKRALCPVNVAPKFHITETGVVKNHLRLRSFFVWGELQWLAALSSKTMLKGTFQSFIGFITRIVPFTMDIVSPSITVKIKHKINHFINASVDTRLCYKKEDNDHGLDLDDRVEYALAFLRGVGLADNFSPCVFIMGHGSSSLNNPHEAAHDCGACGGGRGGPNARLMALILNETAVRAALAERHGLRIPSDTVFIGGYHNTCSSDITFYEHTNISQIQPFCDHIQQAAALDSKERSRRFTAIPIGRTASYYQQKMQQRAIDLRQPRPEYGHATNALCIVGERQFSQQLFLDRRAFLVSYNDKLDEEGSILHATLNSVGPVCAGINLEYYFSYIDNECYGCGTKLPHNVVSLLGVMNGYQSDLQLGLPWQMVEIHQPIRLGLHVICGLDKIRKILALDCDFSRLVRNEWISLSVHNTTDNSTYCYLDGEFVPYAAKANPPTYFRLDCDIMNKPHHLELGHITT